MLASAMGLSVGKSTSTSVVSALSTSFGTVNVKTVSVAFGALSGLTSTCAHAPLAERNAARAPVASAKTARFIPPPDRCPPLSDG